MIRAAVLALALAACAEDVVVIAPVIDSPAPGSEGAAFPDLDLIELSVALDGESEPLVKQTFTRGEPLELRGVPYGENLVVHMLGLVAGAEVAFGRTCRFAVRPGQPPPSPHLYFSRTVKWSDSAFPPSAVRIGGAAITHRQGSGLFLGGRNAAGDSVLGADRFDPLSGRFDEIAILSPRQDGAVAALGDGRIVVAGGVDPTTGVATEIVELISVDAAPGLRVDVDYASQLRTVAAPALATLIDGRIVAFGGIDLFGRPIAQVTEIGAEGGGSSIRTVPNAVLATPRYGHTALRLSDDLGAPVLIIGGRDESGQVVEAAELYKPLIEEMAPLAQPAMKVPRYDHRAVRLPDGSVLIVGGRNASGPVRTLELFSLESGFQVQGELPLSAGVTESTVTLLPDGRVLLAGGRDVNGAVTDAAFIVRLDPIGGGLDVVTTDRLSIPRAGHQATVLCDGTVMVVGGTPEPSPAERYNPPAAGRR